MKTFIKATEIWVPSKDRSKLELNDGVYSDLDDFRNISADMTFDIQQGLPGSVWATGHPLVISDFENSNFVRTKDAQNAGLTCAIGIPVLSGEYLLAVIVFLCGDKDQHAGAIEVWANDPDRSNELGVVDGYYGTSEYFEFTSRKTRIMKGFGLPGMVWEKELPLLIEDLGDSQSFIRRREAKEAGITTGIGMPVAFDQEQIYIMVFLSSKDTPIAKRLQIWGLDEKGESLHCESAFGAQSENLAVDIEGQTFAKGEGLIGKVWFSGIPQIVKSDMANTFDPALSHSLLAMPVIDKGKLKSIVTFAL